MATETLASGLQQLNLQHKSAVSLEKKKSLHYVIDMAAQRSSGEDSLLAATSSNHVIRLFSRSRLAQTCTLKGHKEAITGVQFLNTEPDLLMTVSLDRTLRVWDVRAGRQVQQFGGFGGRNNTDYSLLCCDANSTDRVLCAGTDKAKVDEDAFILFWDRRKHKLLGCYRDSHHDDVTQVHFHPNREQSLITGSIDGLINVFDIIETSEDEALMCTFNTEASVERAGWCGAEANFVYCITHQAAWHVYDTNGDEDDLQVLDLGEKLKGQCELDYLVDCILSAEHSEQVFLLSGTHSGELNLLDLSDPEEPKVVKSLSGGHSDTVRCLHWDEETKSLVTGGEDSILCLWSPNATGIEEVLPKQGKVKGKVLAKQRTAPYAGSRS